ncbi:hypothetical protein H5410_024705 [Solanum commersonii]|uniref:Uncharacterized protein n=1 Tax=Solanum commersonii TaxID=4109 RepID=A0A9J5ZMR5_SOLCO|nr:hypothetical protein H5410_024705 [Solanum commersonii]
MVPEKVEDDEGCLTPHITDDVRSFHLGKRYEHERYNCIRRSRDMKDFSQFIQDIGLIDLPLHGATYTWTRERIFAGFQN